jgi:CubicO group peptidase (beta-lactamase class C family)
VISVLRPSTSDLLTVRLAHEQSRSRLPSVVAGLVRGGELVWSAGCGRTVTRTSTAPPDVDTQYRCGSISKTFTAVAVMRLRDEGLLALDDRVEQHLPDSGLGDVRVAQLLSHSGGLRAESEGQWWERTPGDDFASLAASSLRERARVLGIGERAHYSNVGYGVLGELVARRRGAPWSEVVRGELLEPMGMTRTTPRPQAPAAAGFAVHPYADVLLPEPEHDAGAMAPAGQLWSTVRDLGRWAAFLGGSLPGPLSIETLEEMRRPRALDERSGQPWTVAYGLGIQNWNLAGRRIFGHGGSMPGFLAVLQIEAASGASVIVLTNTTTGMSLTLSTDLLDLLAEHEPVVPTEWLPAPIPGSVLDIVGPWYWGPALFALRAVGSELLDLQPVGHAGRGSRFRPTGPDTWVGLDNYYAGETLRVRRDATGAAVDLDLASFVLTRTPYDPGADVPGGVDPSGWT